MDLPHDGAHAPDCPYHHPGGECLCWRSDPDQNPELKAEQRITKRNDLLREAVQAVLQDPDHFSMTDWLCGTVGCLATHICWAAGHCNVIDGGRVESQDDPRHVESVATELLGLKLYREVNQLFYLNCWPDPYRYDYGGALTARDRAEVLRDRVEHFIATGL